MRRKRQHILDDLVKVTKQIQEQPLETLSDEAAMDRLHAQEVRLRKELNGAPQTEVHSH